MTNKSSLTSIEMAQHSQETVSGHLCDITGVQERFTTQIWLAVYIYRENEILMTQRSFREFSTVMIDYQSMANPSSIVTVLNSRNIMTDHICSCCKYEGRTCLLLKL